MVLTGDAFRHVNGRPYIDPENFNDQKLCTFSHLRFIESIKPIQTDIFVNTYALYPEYDRALRSWYPDAVRYTNNPHLLGEYGLIDNTISQLRQMDLTPYTGILFVRIDLFLREYFLNVFDVNEDSVMYTHLDTHEKSGNGGPYPGVCHNIVFVPKQHISLLLEGIVWKRHESANLLCKRTNKIKGFINTYHSCNTAHEWNPIYAMAGRDEPQILWCGPHGNYRGQRFNWITLQKATIPNDYKFDYLTDKDCRVHWKSNPEALLIPKKRVLIYANCQGRAIRDILAYHSELAKEYNIFGATVISNYDYMNTHKGLPYDLLAETDLFIYQPISSDRGEYSTQELLKTLKPECKTVSFPYLYNYAFWEVLAFSSADYDIGILGMKYAHLNHKPITELRDKGVAFEELETMIRNNTLDWKFQERFETTQRVLREKEQECDVKVADFIDKHYRDHLLFYTQNHPSMFFLRFVAQQILQTLGYNPDILPDEQHLQHPDYNSGHSTIPHYEFGKAAWKYYGFRFLPEPSDSTMEKIIHAARRIYEQPPH